MFRVQQLAFRNNLTEKSSQELVSGLGCCFFDVFMEAPVLICDYTINLKHTQRTNIYLCVRLTPLPLQGSSKWTNLWRVFRRVVNHIPARRWWFRSGAWLKHAHYFNIHSKLSKLSPKVQIVKHRKKRGKTTWTEACRALKGLFWITLTQYLFSIHPTHLIWLTLSASPKWN